MDLEETNGVCLGDWSLRVQFDADPNKNLDLADFHVV